MEVGLECLTVNDRRVKLGGRLSMVELEFSFLGRWKVE